ncbi:MAG: hypothetical protein L0I80_02180 [Brevibacterium sp.]|uniref:hypothetical protein n=1 Tax=Brevibacterium sp. TaxID=1701 RepID=UPI002649E6BC|nr:hypothetical protein [Brevibacterium sp.]MDN5807869.1 hypothetical protein [Brevibacterium sp.]MDN5834343.1 hypothetical protein [Brevibacterium sp.]MDN5877495.1 hypothetical protein [Brevibacterium sp.]MDN5910077.1 hypothetical protein [Brevibacterium sp.]MDN6122668.1 hypothetical protein [Brevibacterium sp.]
MKVVFQGAGAIGIAAAALFGKRHDAVVVSRSACSTPDAVHSPESVHSPGAAYPRQVGFFGRGSVRRRVPVVDWAAVVADSWDLLVLTTRPADLEDTVSASIVALRPGMIAITSQVDGDREIAASMFPDSEILVFSPALLSERTTGRSVRCWRPPGMPVFMASGRRETVRELRRELGGLIVGVPTAMVSGPPAMFIPYVAELSIRDGSWAALRTHLRRPTRAATEAVHAVTGIRMPMSARVAGLVLEALDRFVPIDFGEYAGRHFGRHEGQTRDMVDGWIRREIGREPQPATAQRPATEQPLATEQPQAPAPALRELAQALRLRVTR